MHTGISGLAAHMASLSVMELVPDSTSPDSACLRWYLPDTGLIKVSLLHSHIESDTPAESFYNTYLCTGHNTPPDVASSYTSTV